VGGASMVRDCRLQSQIRFYIVVQIEESAIVVEGVVEEDVISAVVGKVVIRLLCERHSFEGLEVENFANDHWVKHSLKKNLLEKNPSKQSFSDVVRITFSSVEYVLRRLNNKIGVRCSKLIEDDNSRFNDIAMFNPYKNGPKPLGNCSFLKECD